MQEIRKDERALGLGELFILAVGLSMDAFAVSVCKGLSVGKMRWRYAILAGLYFGGFQAGMPLLGYFLGNQFSEVIRSIDHWIAFVLLGIIGLNMIKESREGEDNSLDGSFDVKTMTMLAVATSIDALAVGVTFAFLQVQILPAVAFIGVVTFVFSAAGIKIGNLFGCRFRSKAEFMGGVILICLGAKILLEHLGFLG